MLIERAEYISNKAGSPQSFAFKPDRLNLLVTDEEQKKSDLFSSISMVLWGKAGEDNGFVNLKQGSVSLEIDGKKLNLARDFESNQLNLTGSDDLKINSASDLLHGMGRDTYNSLFLVGQDEVGELRFVDRSTRLTLLGQFAGVSESCQNVEKAVRLVGEKLEKYPFNNRAYKIDDLISGLSRGKIVLEERLLRLERERQDSSVCIDELNKLEEELAQARRTQKREEYFRLCLETAELDSRIMKIQQRMLHEAEIKRELAALGNLFDFPISALRKVQDLWTMRQSRLSDLERLREDIEGSEKEAAIIEEASAKEAEGLEQFSIEDSQQLFSLATVLSSAREELEQLRADRTQEMRRLKDAGVDFDSISLVRKAILAMDPIDLEEANKLASEAKRQKDKLTNLVALGENTGNQLKELTEEMTAANTSYARIKDALFAFAIILFVIAIGAFMLHPVATDFASELIHIAKGIVVTSLVLALGARQLTSTLHNSTRRNFESKIEALGKEQSKHGADELAISDDVASIQQSAETIAKEYEMKSSSELFKKLQTYSSISARLKQLDVLDHMLSTREQQLANLSNETMPYFEKINRKLIQVTPAAITGLASEILRHKETSRELERSSAILNHKLAERRFLEGEILEGDGILRDLFKKARLANPDNIEESYEEFEAKAQAYVKWEKLSLELKSLEKNLGAEILEQDLSTVLYKLQHRRTDAWNTMQDLIVRYPDILTETLEDSEIGRIGAGEVGGFEEELAGKEDRAETLRQTIRTAARNFDEFHPKTQHELEILERDLDKIKRDRDALTLARNSLMQVASENKTSWSQELAEISDDMLRDAGLEVEKLEWDENMELTLTLRNREGRIHENSLSQEVPRGLRKQINWLARLLFCRYIARRLPLPLVLDEPFCDLDDNRFAGCMNLLVKKILPHCQLIILTCQQVRHEWFINKLSAGEKEQIQYV